jgi:transcriptional regulator with XRE-family HTH domain
MQLEPEVAFGIVLRELRKQRNLSQEALAHDADVERNYISLLELGRNSASVKMIFKLAPALGITVSELMTMVETRHKDALKSKRAK